MIFELPNGGIDQVVIAESPWNIISTYSLQADVENLSYDGTSNFSGFGNNANNTIEGGIGADLLLGGKGDDILRGELGDDILDGDSGINQLFGNGGNDLITIGSADTGLVYDLGAGTDRLTLSGAGEHTIAGSGGDGMGGGDPTADVPGTAAVCGA